MKDGFGGEKFKRTYWKRKVIPDGLVQSRNNQLSTVLPKFRVGALNSLESFDFGTSGRKRSWVLENYS